METPHLTSETVKAGELIEISSTDKLITKLNELEKKNKELEKAYLAEKRKGRKLEALYKATISLLTIDINSLLDHLLTTAASAIPTAEKGVLILLNKKTNELEVRAAWGYVDPFTRILALSTAEGYSEKALRERKSLFVPDTRDLMASNSDEEIRGSRSTIVAPLLLSDQALGVLVLSADHPNAFSATDLKLLESFAATATDAIHNAQLHAEVQRLAITDVLTGVRNRRGFFELGQRELERSKRFGHPLVALMLDLDHFKQVNDKYGHGIGDQVLAAVAARCLEQLRTVDLMGRYGGEEFAALLVEIDLEDAIIVAKRLCAALATTPIETDAGPLIITVSVGIAKMDGDCERLEELLAKADQALLTAKQSGRNQVCVWSS
jgi:diguanylate cyclase (GGDEF)-like protein